MTENEQRQAQLIYWQDERIKTLEKALTVLYEQVDIARGSVIPAGSFYAGMQKAEEALRK